MMNQDSWSADLAATICEVEFTKVDGTARKMRCTINEDYIKSYDTTVKKTERVRQANHEVARVFDVEINEWRSFRWDSVTSFARVG